jgi:hypothetical protein
LTLFVGSLHAAGCHPACASGCLGVGISRYNMALCVSPYYNMASQDCLRCTDGYSPTKPSGGCRVGTNPYR